MPGTPSRRKQFLFVDDDPGFLGAITEVFQAMAQGSWEIFTAQNHSQALALLRERSVDVAVLDLDMPVMDGLEFLRLLARTHPGQQVVILTGRATPESRKLCLEQGAALYLEKLITPDGFASVFEALDALANSAPQEGFRGMMRRVGLQEVLQMECLGRKSSVLEVFTPQVRGLIFICEGQIVHSEWGAMEGEMALYGLLGLRGGEFNLRPFSEPARRSISGQYEFLLMEAARLSDEGASPAEPAVPAGAFPQAQAASAAPEAAPASLPESVQIEETVLCSGSGAVLYDYQCRSVGDAVALMKQLDHQAASLARLLPAGQFDRVEFLAGRERIICQLQPEMRLLVRSRTATPGDG